MRQGNIKIKEHSEVTYLGCVLDSTLSGESMATHALGKINGKLKFLYRNQNYLSCSLRRLLCNALIQPHFDFACLAWYPSLNKKIKGKLQCAQNKCIRFCLMLGSRAHLGVKEFKRINWLPTRERFEQCVCVSIFNFFAKTAPTYISEMYNPVEQSRHTRRSFKQLKLPNQTTNRGLKTLSYIGPKLWNALPTSILSVNSVNNFKHRLKENFFEEIQKIEDRSYIFY